MNILPPIEHIDRWPTVCCAWCGVDLNANDNIGLFDARIHFAECQMFLASEPGSRWAITEEGKSWITKVSR